jgi:hypothetical protein
MRSAFSLSLSLSPSPLPWGCTRCSSSAARYSSGPSACRGSPSPRCSGAAGRCRAPSEAGRAPERWRRWRGLRRCRCRPWLPCSLLPLSLSLSLPRIGRSDKLRRGSPEAARESRRRRRKNEGKNGLTSLSSRKENEVKRERCFSPPSTFFAFFSFLPDHNDARRLLRASLRRLFLLSSSVCISTYHILFVSCFRRPESDSLPPSLCHQINSSPVVAYENDGRFICASRALGQGGPQDGDPLGLYV